MCAVDKLCQVTDCSQNNILTLTEMQCGVISQPCGVIARGSYYFYLVQVLSPPPPPPDSASV